MSILQVPSMESVENLLDGITDYNSQMTKIEQAPDDSISITSSNVEYEKFKVG